MARHRLPLAAIVIFSALLGAAVARAQDRAAIGSAPDYDKLVQRGVAEYQRGRWQEARNAFGRAHVIQPNARTLRGLGMTSYQLGRYVEALEYFEQSLVSPVRPLREDLKLEVTRLLRETERMVARLRLELEPAQARVQIDGAPVTPSAQGVVLLDAGEHRLGFEAEGYDAAARRVVCEPGQELTLRVLLTPLRETLSQRAEAPAEPATLPVPPTPAEPVASAAAWIVVGVSGVVLVSGAVLLGVALSDKADLESGRPGGRYWSEARAAYDRVPVLSTVGAVMLGVGAAGLGVGLLWQLWPESELGPRADTTARLGVVPGGLRLDGSF